MTAIKPIAVLDTHLVINQPPPFENINVFNSDTALKTAIMHAGGLMHVEDFSRFGEIIGSAPILEAGELANRFAPTLESFDHYGRRIDEIRLHPAYHQLMQLGIDHGVAAMPWNGSKAGHVYHAALLYLQQHADSGTTCPMTMTCASVAALRTEPAIAAVWVPRILASRYDPASCPPQEKIGVTIGMAMTEKQGGSDIRSNTTRASPVTHGDNWHQLSGHKWFCSAPMSDAFLTLAQTSAGLTCFLVPRWLPDGQRNSGFRIMRLKDKLGDRSNASAERS